MNCFNYLIRTKRNSIISWSHFLNWFHSKYKVCMESGKDFILFKRFTLSHFLVKYQFYWLTYLPLTIPWYNKIVSTFFNLICITYLMKVIIFICVPLNPTLALYLGDFAFDLDSLHDIIWSILSCWLTASVFAFYLLDESNKLAKLQAWFDCLSILETGKDDFFEKLNAQLTIAVKLLIFNLKLTLLFCPWFAFSLFIPHMINNSSNNILVIVLIVHGFITFIAAVCGVTFCVSLSYLFAFYAFLVGQKLTFISKRFRFHILISSNQLVGVLKQAYWADFFWSKLNSYVFLATFFAQIFILYSVFFVKLNAIHLISLIGLGFINFACGLSINFIAGVYARSKVIYEVAIFERLISYFLFCFVNL